MAASRPPNAAARRSREGRLDAATDVETSIDRALADRWPLDPARVVCPLRFVWGLADQILPWPSAAARYRGWFPTADWVELAGVGHCPQLDVPFETAELILGFAA